MGSPDRPTRPDGISAIRPRRCKETVTVHQARTSRTHRALRILPAGKLKRESARDRSS